jgi:hypothetical protein
MTRMQPAKKKIAMIVPSPPVPPLPKGEGYGSSLREFYVNGTSALAHPTSAGKSTLQSGHLVLQGASIAPLIRLKIRSIRYSLR